MRTYPISADNSTNSNFLLSADDSIPLGFLPLVAVVGFLFIGNVGYGTLIWVVTAELLPPKVSKLTGHCTASK